MISILTFMYNYTCKNLSSVKTILFLNQENDIAQS